MSLNPTVSVDYQPWNFERDIGQGARQLEQLVSISWSQPIELGHRTTQRLAIAQAAYDQVHWNILQAELLSLVETYRLHQTASYRREKLRVSEHLAEFNAQLLQTVRRQMEAGHPINSSLFRDASQYDPITRRSPWRRVVRANITVIAHCR